MAPRRRSAWPRPGSARILPVLELSATLDEHPLHDRDWSAESFYVPRADDLRPPDQHRLRQSRRLLTLMTIYPRHRPHIEGGGQPATGGSSAETVSRAASQPGADPQALALLLDAGLVWDRPPPAPGWPSLKISLYAPATARGPELRARAESAPSARPPQHRYRNRAGFYLAPTVSIDQAGGRHGFGWQLRRPSLPRLRGRPSPDGPEALRGVVMPGRHHPQRSSSSQPVRQNSTLNRSMREATPPTHLLCFSG